MPNLAGSRPNGLSCSLNIRSFCSACASVAMIGIQPSPSRAARSLVGPVGLSGESPEQLLHLHVEPGPAVRGALP
jgi:hypothetical protein